MAARDGRHIFLIVKFVFFDGACFEPGKKGFKDWQDPVYPCILPFLVQK